MLFVVVNLDTTQCAERVNMLSARKTGHAQKNMSERKQHSKKGPIC